MPSAAGTALLIRFVQKRTTQIGAGENARRMAEDSNGVEGLETIGPGNGGK
jgi:hypothetical protein